MPRYIICCRNYGQPGTLSLLSPQRKQEIFVRELERKLLQGNLEFTKKKGCCGQHRFQGLPKSMCLQHKQQDTVGLKTESPAREFFIGLFKVGEFIVASVAKFVEEVSPFFIHQQEVSSEDPTFK